MRNLLLIALFALLAITCTLATESSSELAVADESLMEMDSTAFAFEGVDAEEEMEMEAEAEVEAELEADKPKKKKSNKGKKPAKHTNKGKHKGQAKKADPHAIPSEFIDWMKANGKSYATPAERLKRFNIWKQAHSRFSAPAAPVVNAGAEAGVTQGAAPHDDDVKFSVHGPFADLTEQEFEETYLRGIKLSSQSLLEQFNTLQNGQSADDRREGEIFFETEADVAALTQADLDALADARAEMEVDAEAVAEMEASSISFKHLCSGVKNQGQCGSCWAFATTEVLESAVAKAGHGKKVLAPQALVDCDHSYANGCNGGDPNLALAWYQAHPSRYESHYRYRAHRGSCRSPGPAGPRVKAHGFACGGSCRGRESTMLSELRQHGPMGVIVNANSAWQYYHGGVMSPSRCSSSSGAGNHAVVVVGYSSHGYWIVRNSWGTRWGERGYIRLRYGHNTCGVGNYVVWAQA